MKKNRMLLLSLIAVMMTACGNPDGLSSNPSSSEGDSLSVSDSSESVAPEVMEAPKIDKVAKSLDDILKNGLVSYDYSQRYINRNFLTGEFMSNDYKTISAQHYSNGVDAVQTLYKPEGYELTSENVNCSGPLRTYKLDEDYYVYGYIPLRNNLPLLGSAFVEILERNRYNDETTMEFYSNGISVALNEFNGQSGWDPIYGYESTPYTAELNEAEGYYYCKIGATAPETDRYGEEDNYAWVKMDAYDHSVLEVGVHLQVKARHGTGDYGGEITQLTEVTLKNFVAGELEEGVIEPLDFGELPLNKITDYRAKPVDLEEGVIDPNKVKEILKNLRCYTNGTNYSHRDYYEEVFDEETNESLGYARGYADAYAVNDEAVSVYTYLDKDNDPSTPYDLVETNLNVATDEGIRCETFYNDSMPGYENGYKYSSIVSPSDIYSVNDFLNPNGYFISAYSMVFSEVAAYGWGVYDNGWNVVNYKLNKHTYANNVIDIEFDIEFQADEYTEAHADTYVIQITNGFLNKIASKRNGSPYFDTWTNYIVESLY